LQKKNSITANLLMVIGISTPTSSLFTHNVFFLIYFEKIHLQGAPEKVSPTSW